MSELLLTHDALAALVEELAAAGRPAVAPAWAGDSGRGPGAPGAARETEYRTVTGAAELALGERLPRLSLKQFFLPPTEVLFSWRRTGGEVELTPAPTAFPEQVVLGARPCDAAALPIVDHVMNWDYADELWNARRAATTVFSLACGVEDGSCFCSAVSLDPAAEKGSDGRLTPVDGGYLVETFTDKGAAFLVAHRRLVRRAGGGRRRQGAARPGRGVSRDRPRARRRPTCSSTTAACATGSTAISRIPSGRRWGRAATAAACARRSARRAIASTSSTSPRAWPAACVGATGTPVRPASSRNTPQATTRAHDQNARFRQRVEHKFLVYPLRFGDALCTGCGRCSRACPTGQDLAEILAAIDERAAQPPLDAGQPAPSRLADPAAQETP